jgi:hypothetical protein
MATLSAGIGAPLVAQRSDLKSGQRRDAHPGGIIPLQVAQSSRYEWRHHLVKGGGFRRNQQEIYQVFERMTIAAPVQRFSNGKRGLRTGGAARLA